MDKYIKLGIIAKGSNGNHVILVKNLNNNKVLKLFKYIRPMQ
jgi:hypothetical protein